MLTDLFASGGVPHSVTQSSFANPCTPLAAANGSGPGFDSGLQQAKQFSITITDDSTRMFLVFYVYKKRAEASSLAIWFHCKQQTHCGLGMVGAINAPASGQFSFSAFQSAAKAIGSNEATVCFLMYSIALVTDDPHRRRTTDQSPAVSVLLLARRPPTRRPPLAAPHHRLHPAAHPPVRRARALVLQRARA